MDDSKGTLATLLETLKEQNASKAGMAPSEINGSVKTQIEETKKQNELVKKSVETLRRIEDVIKGNYEQLKVLPKNLADKLNVSLSDLKVPEQDKTTLESIKELVGDTKSFFGKLSGSMGKGFDFIKNPMGVVKSGIEKVKEIGTKAQDTFYDIAETKAGYTAEEGRFVEEYKKQNRKFASGMTREEIVSGKLQNQGTDLFRQKKDLEEKIKSKQVDVERSKKYGFEPTQEDKDELEALVEREKNIFSTKNINQEKQSDLDKINQQLMAKANVGEWGDEETSQLQKKKKEITEQLFETTTKSGEEKLKSVESRQTKNEEADNVISAQESIAESFKENNELLKELLTTTKDQLNSVKAIKDSLAPKTTDEQDIVQQKKEKFYGNVTTKLDEISGKLDNVGSSGGGSLLDTATDLLGKGGKGAGQAAGKAGLGSRILGGLKSAGPGLLKGGLGAIGGMALGYGADKLVEAGHEKTGGALGVGAEALSGAGMGAMIGSVIPGVGTAIGGAVGGVAGGAYGLYKNWGNLFGGDKKKDGDGELSTKYGKEAEKIAEEALKNGTNPSDLEAAILEKLREKYKDENIEFLESAAFSAAMKANNKKDTKGSEQKSDKFKAGSKEYSSIGELDQKQNPKAFNNAYQKEVERRGEKDTTSNMEKVEAGAEPTTRIVPAPARKTGADMATATTENTELNRETSRAKPAAPIIMNNSTNTSSSSFVPIKAAPRPDFNGSALDRYQSKITSY